MARLQNKMALITGAASGLGAATAKMMAKEGARIALADIDLSGAQSVANEINEINANTAQAFPLDVSSESQWQNCLESATDFLGGLNVLVNNAGIASSKSVEDETFETWKKVHEVDLDSVFLGCKYALPYMRAHAPGSIVNISSIAGLIAGHNLAAYNSAKAGVWMLTKSIALHCARKNYNIRCNSIHPTFVKTPILDAMVPENRDKQEILEKLARQIPLKILGEPEDIAYAAIYLASDESKFMTGAEIKLDGGISAM